MSSGIACGRCPWSVSSSPSLTSRRTSSSSAGTHTRHTVAVVTEQQNYGSRSFTCFFCLWNDTLPHLRQAVCVFTCILPKLCVPFVILASGRRVRAGNGVGSRCLEAWGCGKVGREVPEALSQSLCVAAVHTFIFPFSKNLPIVDE